MKRIKDLRLDVKEHALKLMKEEKGALFIHNREGNLENISLRDAFCWSGLGKSFDIWANIHYEGNYKPYDEFFKIKFKVPFKFKLYL